MRGLGGGKPNLIYGTTDNGVVGDRRSTVESGPPVEQGKTEQILVHVRKQDTERKGRRSSLETHSQEIKEVKDVTRHLAREFEILIDVIKEVITNCQKMEQAVKKRDGRKKAC